MVEFHVGEAIYYIATWGFHKCEYLEIFQLLIIHHSSIPFSLLCFEYVKKIWHYKTYTIIPNIIWLAQNKANLSSPLYPDTVYYSNLVF